MKALALKLMFFVTVIMLIGCSTSLEGKLLCVKFTSNIPSIKYLIMEINNKKRGLPCSSVTKVKISKEYSHPEDASKIWSLYNLGVNYQILDESLYEFLDKYMTDEIGVENCRLVIEEVKSWLDHPQMEEHVEIRIREALRM